MAQKRTKPGSDSNAFVINRNDLKEFIEAVTLFRDSIKTLNDDRIVEAFSIAAETVSFAHDNYIVNAKLWLKNQKIKALIESADGIDNGIITLRVKWPRHNRSGWHKGRNGGVLPIKTDKAKALLTNRLNHIIKQSEDMLEAHDLLTGTDHHIYRTPYGKTFHPGNRKTEDGTSWQPALVVDG